HAVRRLGGVEDDRAVSLAPSQDDALFERLQDKLREAGNRQPQRVLDPSQCLAILIGPLLQPVENSGQIGAVRMQVKRVGHAGVLAHARRRTGIGKVMNGDAVVVWPQTIRCEGTLLPNRSAQLGLEVRGTALLSVSSGEMRIGRVVFLYGITVTQVFIQEDKLVPCGITELEGMHELAVGRFNASLDRQLQGGLWPIVK